MIIDTFPDFLELWERIRDLPVQAQMERWESYIAAWPEVRDLLVKDYADQGLDWRAVARERVFPFLAQRLPQMEAAHLRLLGLCEPIHQAARDKLGFDEEVVFFIYVGIGCGAGWATRYRDTHAVLLGLENIAEEGWTERDALAGLLAHELGHLVLAHRRAVAGLSLGSGPLWQLYDEGFAVECERLILGRCHVLVSVAAESQGWYCENAGMLAAEFLRRADTNEDVRPFFGSWLEFQGHRYCGYFLGSEVIRRLRESGKTLEEIAVLENVEGLISSCLCALGREPSHSTSRAAGLG